MAKPKARRTRSSRAARVRNAAQLRSAAYHEAGHAVVGRVLTLVCGLATIKPNYEQMQAGVSICADPYECEMEWQKRGKYRDGNAVWHARIIAYMAGAETEKELLGQEALGDADDQLQIELMATDNPWKKTEVQWEKLESRLRAMTRMLVRRHKALIERVAKALLTKTTLSARQLDKMVGKSVADVKRNSPTAYAAAMNESERKALRAALEDYFPLSGRPGDSRTRYPRGSSDPRISSSKK